MSGCSKECSCNDLQPSKSLFDTVDVAKVLGINERVKGSAAEVLKKSHAERHTALRAEARTDEGLVLKIPFLYKVALVRLEIKTSFRKVDLTVNNPYVTLRSPSKAVDTFSLPGNEHIIPISLAPYKYKSVDHLTIKLQSSAGEGTFSYLGLYGTVTGKHPTAVKVSYELYPVPDKTETSTKRLSDVPLNK